MDLGSECSISEVVEDNEEISNDSVPKNLGSNSEPKVQNNGSCVVENNDHNELYPDVKQKADISDCEKHSNSPPADLRREISPRKGHGLRKWRRIKRDTRKVGDSTTVKVMTHQSPNSDVNSSKRMQYAERKQKSEGSVSSTNAVGQRFDDFGLELCSQFAAGTDSENSEDRSSKSSTAASAPKINCEMPNILGFPHDRSLSGTNLTQQGKGRVISSKKARGERVKIEKENSHSSLESDSRSSNFLFMQGTYSTKNGIRDERLKHYQGENGDEVEGSEQVTEEQQGFSDGDGEGGYEGGVADSSSEVKEERSENLGSSSDQDPFDEASFALQSAQEALEKELLMLQEIGKDSSDLGTEIIDYEQETSSKQLPDESVHIFSRPMESEIVETETEDRIKQKTEAEVKYMAISGTVQTLRVAAVDQITILEEQKAVALEQTQILDKLGAAENKAAVLKKEAEKLEEICEDIASADDIMKLQNRVYKYSTCFLVQLVLLLVILLFFMLHVSPGYVDDVPT